MKNKKTLLFSLGFLLLLAIVSGTSYQLLVNKEAKENTAATNVKNDAAVDSETKDNSKPVASYVVEDVDATHKSFSDSEFDLKFKYDKSLELKRDKSQGGLWLTLSHPNFDINIYKWKKASEGGFLAQKGNTEIVNINGREFVFLLDFYKYSDNPNDFSPIGLVYEKYLDDPEFLAKAHTPFNLNGASYEIVLEPKNKGNNEETKKILIDLINSINF